MFIYLFIYLLVQKGQKGGIFDEEEEVYNEDDEDSETSTSMSDKFKRAKVILLVTFMTPKISKNEM